MGSESVLIDIYKGLKEGKSSVPCSQIRDLTKIDLGDKFSLVVAVDSDGGIGPLRGDVIKCPAYILGRFAIRVPLMEILASGSVPIAAFDMLTIPMKGPGEEIVRGVRDELLEAGLDDTFPLSGSTEDNVPANMTGVGTTVIGVVHKSDFRPGSSKSGDEIICIGTPKSGPDDEVRLDDKDIVCQNNIRKILKVEGVHDILPVGSHGIAYEVGEMAKLASLKFELAKNISVNLNKSAGPSTCVLSSCTKSAVKVIKEVISTPVFLIGRMQ